MAKITLPTERLIRLSKAKSCDLAVWHEGVAFGVATGLTLKELMHGVAADRWRLATRFRRDAGKMLAATPSQCRSSLSRSYYSMYHAMRAAAYIYHKGDDNEQHTVLPGATPPDFAHSATWQNALKDARLTRNRADYDPYPKSDYAWHSDAVRLKEQADALLIAVRDYLRSKGSTWL